MTNKMPVVGQHYKLLRPATGSYYGNFKPLSHVRTFNEHFEVRELKIGEYLKLNEVFKFAYGYRAQFLATDGFGVNFKFNTYSPKSDREYSENSWDYFFEELPEDSLQKAGYIDKAEIWKLLDYNKKYKEKNSNKIVKLNSIGTAEVMFRYEGKNYNEGEFNKCSPSSFLNFFQELPEDSLQEKEEVQEVASKYFNVAALKANATALWNDFRFKKDYRFEEPADNEPKVNGTHNPVDFEKIEVNEKEQDFIHAFTGDLIEYQGKRYVCAFETDYLPNERAEDWKQTDYSSPQYKHKKIKFRDLFAKKEINEVEMALEKLKLKLKDDVWCESQYHYELLDLIKNLINALDNQKNENSYHDAISQYPKGVKAHSLYPYKPCKCCSDPEVYAEFMSKPDTKINTKEERVDQVSIWKDGDELKELENQNENFLIRTKDGRVLMPILSNIFTDDNEINKNIKEATTLTDFINSFEQTQKDIEEIKKKL